MRLFLGTFENRERANNNRSRASADLASEGVTTPAERTQRQDFAVSCTSYDHPSLGPTLCAGCEGYGRDTDDGGREMAAQLGVVGTLLEENVRRQLQSRLRICVIRAKNAFCCEGETKVHSLN